MSYDPYPNYKRVSVTLQIIDNGQGAGYLRLQWPDGSYHKVEPLGTADLEEALYDAMKAYLDSHPNEAPAETIEGGCWLASIALPASLSLP